MSQNIFSKETLSELRLQNPAEYIIYMWKLEDMVRAFPTEKDFEEYCKEARSNQNVDAFISILESVRKELVEDGNLEIVGKHTKSVQSLIEELEAEHKRLCDDKKEEVYEGVYIQVLPSILALKGKSGGKNRGEIETCLIAIYGYHTLQSKNEEVFPETLEMLKKISLLLKVLGEKRMNRLQQNKN